MDGGFNRHPNLGIDHAGGSTHQHFSGRHPDSRNVANLYPKDHNSRYNPSGFWPLDAAQSNAIFHNPDQQHPNVFLAPNEDLY